MGLNVLLIEIIDVANISNINCVASEFLSNGWWDLDKLRDVLQKDIVQKVIVGLLVLLVQVWIKLFGDVFLMEFSPRLLSNEKRVRRQITSDSSCMTCCGPIQSIAHIFKDCSRDVCIWESMGVPRQLRNAQNLRFKAWLLGNLKYIWKWRNKQIFYVNFVVPMDPKMIIVRDVAEWLKACVKSSIKLVKRQISLSYDHLDLTIDKGAIDLHIEMDSKAIVMLLKQTEVDNFHHLETIMHSCRLMMRQLRRCELNHIYREKNIVADQLANWSYNMDIGVLVFDEPPVWIGPTLIDVAAGVPQTRFDVVL
ncbi:hypothetical protein ACFX12_029665 [Malus domestica]